VSTSRFHSRIDLAVRNGVSLPRFAVCRTGRLKIRVCRLLRQASLSVLRNAVNTSFRCQTSQLGGVDWEKSENWPSRGIVRCHRPTACDKLPDPNRSAERLLSVAYWSDKNRNQDRNMYPDSPEFGFLGVKLNSDEPSCPKAQH